MSVMPLPHYGQPGFCFLIWTKQSQWQTHYSESNHLSGWSCDKGNQFDLGIWEHLAELQRCSVATTLGVGDWLSLEHDFHILNLHTAASLFQSCRHTWVPFIQLLGFPVGEAFHACTTPSTPRSSWWW